MQKDSIAIGPPQPCATLIYSSVRNRCVVCKTEIEEKPRDSLTEYKKLVILVCSDECQAMLPPFPFETH